MTKPKPWRLDVGAMVGLAVGLLFCWSAYDPASGLLQKLNLILVPTTAGMLVVNLRNRRKKVGSYDPETIERNKRGVVCRIPLPTHCGRSSAVLCAVSQ